MTDKKAETIGFRLRPGERRIIERAAVLTRLDMSVICRFGGVALAALIVKNKGDLQLPVKFKSLAALLKK